MKKSYTNYSLLETGTETLLIWDSTTYKSETAGEISADVFSLG